MEPRNNHLNPNANAIDQLLFVNLSIYLRYLITSLTFLTCCLIEFVIVAWEDSWNGVIRCLSVSKISLISLICSRRFEQVFSTVSFICFNWASSSFTLELMSSIVRSSVILELLSAIVRWKAPKCDEQQS